jgi:hypothetical protein
MFGSKRPSLLALADGRLALLIFSFAMLNFVRRFCPLGQLHLKYSSPQKFPEMDKEMKIGTK